MQGARYLVELVEENGELVKVLGDHDTKWHLDDARRTVWRLWVFYATLGMLLLLFIWLLGRGRGYS